ncbi:MAG: hypothetical protein MK226_01635, partial [Saprospiraceae bacterium]|nr:hypothetical protein [Saprospiraceae bacterium]
EPGIDGVTVNLLDENGNQIATTTTSGGGAYEFTGLLPGDYIVEFITPTLYEPTDQDQGGDDALDSDADPITGQTAVVNLESGETDNTIDAGYGRYDLALDKALSASNVAQFEPGSLVNYDITVTNEGGLPAMNIVVTDRFPAGMTFNSFDALGTAVTSNGDGTFNIPSLLEGESVTFMATFMINNDFQGFELINVAEITTDDGDDIDSTPNNDVPSEDDQDEVPIVVAQTPSIAIEKSTNGEDADMAPGPIILVPNDGATINWEYVVTNDGTLDLSNVVVTDDIEGQVCVIPFLAAGDSFTCNLSGDAQLGQYENIATATGQPVDTNGNSIGGPVTDDDPSHYVGVFINIEKIADKTEICAGEEVTFTLTTRLLGGAPGVQLRDISAIDNNLPDMLIPYDQYFVGGDLNGNGYIDFIDNNNDGISDEEFVWTYTLTYNQTTTNMAMDEAQVWFVDQSTGTETLIGMVMNNDEVTVTVDQNLCASIGDFVWEDINQNGIQDTGEPGIEDVTVNLLDGNGNQIGTTTTASDGYYEFTELTPGNYIVEFVTPTGFNPSPSNQGGDDTVDSDADESTGQTGVITLANGDNDPTNDAGFIKDSNISHEKSFVSSTPNVDGTFTVVYSITVNNDGGQGQYDLTDIPGYDDDIMINSASYVSDAPGNAANTLAGTGPWTLADDQFIGAYSTHIYTLTVNVSISITDGQGDDDYTACGETNGTPQAGEGLYNMTELDLTNDGTPEQTDDACGDLPAIDHEKSFVSAIPNANGTFTVTYEVTVNNSGAVVGSYDLTDIPSFDDDVTINSASYTSDATGNAGGALAGTGPWTLADDQTIGANSTHIYTLTVNVSISITDGQGDDDYTACGETNGTPQAGEGLYNMTELDLTNDGTPEQTDDACGDLPAIDHEKSFVSAIQQANGSHNVVYTVVVNNSGAAAGAYDLTDVPGYDDDVTINSASYVSDAPGNTANALVGIGPWILADDQVIAAGVTHTYTVTVNVTLNVSNGQGDDIYTLCGGTNGTPQLGEGLYNITELDLTNDGTPEQTDDACGDLEVIDLELEKYVSNTTPDEGSDIVFTITLENKGPNNASGVIVSDQLPSGYAYVSHIAEAATVYNDATGLWNIGNLTVGQLVTLEITVTVLADGDYINLSEVTDANEDDIDSTPDNGVDTDGDDVVDDDPEDEDDGDGVTVDPVQMTASVDIEKSTNGQDADDSPGVIILVDPNNVPTITWEYVVTNTGTLDLTDLVVTDDQEGMVCTIPFLAAGESITCTMTGAAQLGMYTNIADVVGQPIGGNGNPFGDPVTDEDPSNYTGVWINVEKNADKDQICTGEEVNYDLTIRLLGGATGVQLRNIMLNDNNLIGTLDVNSPEFVESSDINNNEIIEFFDNDGDGVSDEEFVFEYSLTLNATTVNVAMDMADVYFVDNNGNEFFIGEVNNMDEVTVDVANPELTITVNPASQDIVYGNDGIITVTVTNTGDIPLEDVIITDNNGNIDCEITFVSLAVGESSSYTCTLPSIITNTVVDLEGTANAIGTVGAQTGADLCGASASAEATFTVLEIIDLSLVKIVDNSTPDVGTDVIFTITVTNDGPAPATGVEVTDQLPSGFNYVSSDGAYDAGSGVWTIGDMGIGETVTLNITATVLATGDYVNLAEVTDANEQDSDSTPGNGADTDGDGDVGPL